MSCPFELLEWRKPFWISIMIWRRKFIRVEKTSDYHLIAMLSPCFPFIFYELHGKMIWCYWFVISNNITMKSSFHSSFLILQKRSPCLKYLRFRVSSKISNINLWTHQELCVGLGYVNFINIDNGHNFSSLHI